MEEYLLIVDENVEIIIMVLQDQTDIFLYLKILMKILLNNIVIKGIENITDNIISE